MAVAAFGPNYKAAYCLAVCPAGEDVIGPFLADRGEFVAGVVDPLRAKEEPVYVIPGSDAEAHVARKFPHKRPVRVGSGRRPMTVRSFLKTLPYVFQRHQSEGLAATYHFTFTGREPAQATVVIRDKTIRVEDGHVGTADLSVRADSEIWMGFGPRRGASSGAAAAEDRAQGESTAARRVREVLPESGSATPAR